MSNGRLGEKKKCNIIIPAGVDGQGWTAMAKMFERIIHGDTKVKEDEREMRTKDGGGKHRSDHDLSRNFRGDTQVNLASHQKTGANRGVLYADVLKSKLAILGSCSSFLELHKVVVVCTRTDFFNDWAQIEKELDRSFKASIVLRPFQ